MDVRQATENLEVIRTLMERTCQYELLTARAGLVAGSLAGVGALSFLILDASDPWHFGLVWGLVFLGSLLTTSLCTIFRARERGEPVWSRQAKAVLFALMPATLSAFALSIFFFYQGMHLWLPGVWMLCYGQGALATSAYAPQPIRALGMLVLLLGAFTLTSGPNLAIWMMGLVFGLGHGWLGVTLLLRERRERSVRLFRTVA
mgnify:CR=1 FL=1